MKCALIGPVYPYRGGIAHYTTLLSQALQRHNVDLLLISFARQYPQWLFPGRTDRDPSATPFATTAAHYWIDSLNPFTWLFSFARIRRYRPDLIILQWWTLFWFPIWWCLLWLNRMFLGAPVLWICHNVLPHEPSWLDRFAARALLRFGCRVIVHSAAEAETLHRLLPHLSYTIVEMPAFPIFGKAIDRSTARSAQAIYQP
ncbi:MAG: glycosyltransferase [Caldilineaceae bacterium]